MVVIAAGAYLAGRDACEKAKDFHVYVVSGQADSQRSVGFEVVTQYLKNTDFYKKTLITHVTTSAA